MVGQFIPLERKSIEPIALAVKDGNVRAVQRFVSDAPWDDDKMIANYRSLVNDELETLIEQIIWIQNRNHKAYLSHWRMRILKLVKEP